MRLIRYSAGGLLVSPSSIRNPEMRKKPMTSNETGWRNPRSNPSDALNPAIENATVMQWTSTTPAIERKRTLLTKR